MKITLEPTAVIVLVNDVAMRVWTGTTSNGAPVTAYVHRLEVPTGALRPEDFEHLIAAAPIKVREIKIEEGHTTISDGGISDGIG